MNTGEILLEHLATHAAVQVCKIRSQPTEREHAVAGICEASKERHSSKESVGGTVLRRLLSSKDLGLTPRVTYT